MAKVDPHIIILASGCAFVIGAITWIFYGPELGDDDTKYKPMRGGSRHRRKNGKGTKKLR